MFSSKSCSKSSRHLSPQNTASLTPEHHPTPPAVPRKPSASAVPFPDSELTRRSSTSGSGGGRSGRGSDVAAKSGHKSPGLAMEELLKPGILIQPHPPNTQTKPVPLQQLMLLPRECLSLSYMDLADPYGELPACRFFESRIRIMELESRLGSNVLIARSDTSKRSLYAIERHNTGHYVICRLGDWVQVEDLAQDATVCCRERINRASLVTKSLAVADKTFVPDLQTLPLYKPSSRQREAIENLQSLCRKKPKTHNPKIQSQEDTSCHLPTPVDGSIGDEIVAEPSATQGIKSSTLQILHIDSEVLVQNPAPYTPQTAEEIFANIRSNYFEALYHSKGNLAYFPKGPLSRARAAFHLNVDGILETEDLINFLKSLVLTTVSIDKKYLSTIPNMIEQMKIQVDTSDDGAGKLLKKKPKKAKLGKNGLYGGEDQDCKKWWYNTKPELKDDEVSVEPQHIRYHVSCLRRRETLLQMILIMEILALEAATPQENPADVQLPGTEPSPAAAKPADIVGAKKKRNRHNYPVLLDVHADRLCIWESTTLDEVKAFAESQAHESGIEKSDKPLRDFCVEIIVPFFSPRLPEICEALNRKLGGPVKQSPKKQRREKAATGASLNKSRIGSTSGSVSKKSVTGKLAKTHSSTQSLERMLSKDKLRRSVSRGPTDALAHLRHATVAHIPGLKREGSESRFLSDTRSLKDTSETLVGELSPVSIGSKGRPTNSLMHSRSASFNGMDDIKAKKKAMVDTELRNAISALKKPNRLLAGKVMVEETERRLFGGPTYVSNVKKLVQSPISSVQVKATPANTRFKDVLSGEGDDALQYGKGFKLARGRSVTQPVAATLSVAEKTAEVGMSPCVTRTPILRKSPGSREGRDAVLGSSPIQAKKVAPRPQNLQSESERLQGSRSRPAAPDHGCLYPYGENDAIPASSPHKLATASEEDPLVAALATTPIGRKRGFPPQQPDLSSRPTTGTPVKRARTSMTIVASPTRQERALGVSLPKEKSIYQQLGWDDDLDDLL